MPLVLVVNPVFVRVTRVPPAAGDADTFILTAYSSSQCASLATYESSPAAPMATHGGMLPYTNYHPNQIIKESCYHHPHLCTLFVLDAC